MKNSSYIVRLIIFTVSAFFIFTVIFGLTWLPYQKAYWLVHPNRQPVTSLPEDVGITDYENVSFTSPDGLTLRGWYVPPRNGAVVIFVHGLGGNRTELLDEAGFVTAQGYGALLFDLRNHGESEGEITTLGLYEQRDVSAAAGFVTQKAGDGIKMALFGHSMGAGTVLLAAPDLPQVGAVIVESAYTSVRDNISDGVRSLTGLPPFPFAPLVIFFGEWQAGADIEQVHPIDSIGVISPRPILLIHGEEDTTIPVENAYRLYDAAQAPKELYVLPGVGHVGFLQAQPQAYPARILSFLDGAFRDNR